MRGHYRLTNQPQPSLVADLACSHISRDALVLDPERTFALGRNLLRATGTEGVVGLPAQGPVRWLRIPGMST